jgi:hypothetical protein
LLFSLKSKAAAAIAFSGIVEPFNICAGRFRSAASEHHNYVCIHGLSWWNKLLTLDGFSVKETNQH